MDILTDVQREILDLKIKKNTNNEIQKYINKKYQKSYTINYISTIFRQKIIPSICEAVEYHQEIIGNLFFEENLDEEKLYEKIKRCNTIILLNTLTFKNKQKFLSYFNSTIDKEVYLCTTYFDIVLLGNNVKSINDVLSYEQKPLKIEFVERILKRTIDILCSLLILLVSLPVWLFVPIIIKAQDGGPVFYKQVRLTKGMKEFNILKF